MGRVWDFAKRRIAGYIVFWLVVVFVIYVFYKGNLPAQAGIFILAFAFTVSVAFTGRMKRKQRERREVSRLRGR